MLCTIEVMDESKLQLPMRMHPTVQIIQSVIERTSITIRTSFCEALSRLTRIFHPELLILLVFIRFSLLIFSLSMSIRIFLIVSGSIKALQECW